MAVTTIFLTCCVDSNIYERTHLTMRNSPGNEVLAEACMNERELAIKNYKKPLK